MEFLYLGDPGAATILLAHGAGAPMDSSWMNEFCGLLASRGIRTARFEFAYMAARRQGARRPAPRADLAMPEYLEAVAAVDRAGGPLLIGGKSYGGRVASMVADELWRDARLAGLVCLGYPFHPPEKPELPRTAHLAQLETPTLIVQGTRDPLGSRDEVENYALSPTIELMWLEDGEHDFRPRKAVSGFTFAQHFATAADAVTAFALRAV